jgi:hypothetical protein
METVAGMKYLTDNNLVHRIRKFLEISYIKVTWQVETFCVKKKMVDGQQKLRVISGCLLF